MMKDKTIVQYFGLVLLISIPFWVLGYFANDITKNLPIRLPISALMAVCPLIAAVILTYQNSNTKSKSTSITVLLQQVMDYKKIQDQKWYWVILFLIPIITVISYALVQLTSTPNQLIPTQPISLIGIILFTILFFVGAIGEEIGWSGYIINPLQQEYGALKASIILGSYWAIWHIIPYNQAGQSVSWIFWQCTGTVFLRIIMVWIFNNTGKSVLGMIVFHTMINISPYLIPDYGSRYNPFIFTVLLIIISLWIITYWNSPTLTKYKLKNTK
jgi:uncharacterized protein